MQPFWLNVLEQQLDTDLKEKLNIFSLLEFYINFLARKKYKQILIHNVTFYKYVGIYLHIREAIVYKVSSCAIPETGVGASPHIPVLSVCF